MAWDGSKACQRKNIAFSMKVYNSIKIFGDGLYLLYCFRVSSLTVEGGRNLFMYIAREI